MSFWATGFWKPGFWKAGFWFDSVPTSAAIPNEVGVDKVIAAASIASAGFTSSLTFAQSDSVSTDLVISQLPIGGTIADFGTLVALTISLGLPAPITTPRCRTFFVNAVRNIFGRGQ